jgi:hypothetical protein
VAGVEWCVLTDGDSYRFYNATAAVDADEKLFCQVRLSEGAVAAAAASLALISHDNMRGNILDALWAAHYVDRRVKETVRTLFATADKALVRMIRRKTAKLTPKEILDSIRRLDVRIESMAPPPTVAGGATEARTNPGAGKPPWTATKGRASGKAKVTKRGFGVSLADVVKAGVLSPPLPLFRRYRKVELSATLQPDGSVEFGGAVYRSCSTAAEVARSTVTGRKMNTNGWTFWQYRDGDAKLRELSAARNEFLVRADKALH